jgi:hypothetical protein
MAIETWSPGGSGFGLFGGQAVQNPPGDGWKQTGTKRVQVYAPPKAGGPQYKTVPIYTRVTTPAPAPAPAPAPIVPPAPSIPSSPTPTANRYTSQISQLEQQLGSGQTSQPKSYNYTDPGDKGYFGMADYNELAGQGASRADLIRYAFSAPRGVGPAVASMLGIRSSDSPVPSSLSYTDPGDQGFFGMKDFEELAKQGATFQQIKDYASKAQYGVGAEVANILGMPAATEPKILLAQADQRAKDLEDRLTKQAQEYETAIAQTLKSFEDSQKKAEEAAKLRQEMMIKSQATIASNMARAGKTASLQIGTGGETPATAGTQSFKRRRGRVPTISSALSALPGTTAQSSILNV